MTQKNEEISNMKKYEAQWESIKKDINGLTAMEALETVFFFFAGQIESIVLTIEKRIEEMKKEIEEKAMKPVSGLMRNLSSDTPTKISVVELRRLS